MDLDNKHDVTWSTVFDKLPRKCGCRALSDIYF